MFWDLCLPGGTGPVLLPGRYHVGRVGSAFKNRMIKAAMANVMDLSVFRAEMPGGATKA